MTAVLFSPLVAIIDSGIDPEGGMAAPLPVAQGRAFRLAVNEGVDWGDTEPDLMGHGTRVAALVAAEAPMARLLNAQVFAGRPVTSAAQVAAGLDWAREEGAALAVLSLGLRGDRPVLARAVAAAVARGMLLVASAPARGLPVYPAAYPGVLRVSGDARCRPGELSWLGDGVAEYGCCPADSPQEGAPPLGGASFAAARLGGLLTAALAEGAFLPGQDPHAFLRCRARYVGRERITATGTGGGGRV